MGVSFGAGEIPQLSSFLHIFDEAELGLTAHLLDLRSSLRVDPSQTVSGGEFGWGGTSVK